MTTDYFAVPGSLTAGDKARLAISLKVMSQNGDLHESMFPITNAFLNSL
jgi:hypothetical protein